MNKKTLFLVITLVAMLILVTSVNAATDNTNTSTTHSISEKTTTTEPVVKEEKTQTKTEKQANTKEKEIVKDNKTNKNSKKSITIDGITYNNVIENQVISDDNWPEITENTFYNHCTFTNTDSGIDNYATIYINNSEAKGESYQYSFQLLNNEPPSKMIINNSKVYQLYNAGDLFIYNSTLNDALTTFGDSVIVIDELTTLGPNFNVIILTWTETRGLIYTNNTQIISKLEELNIPGITIISDDSNDDNIIIENQTITDANTNSKNLTYINCILNSKILNYGSLTLINSTLNSTIENLGTLIIDDNCVLGENLVLENKGEIVCNNSTSLIPYSTIINGNYALENIILNSNKTNNGNLTLINCNITAKIINNGNLTLQNCSLSNNKMTTSDSKTDGFLLENTGNLTMIDCVVENNTFNTTSTNIYNHELYGAILNRGLLKITNSTFCNNSVGFVSYSHDDYFTYAETIGKGSCIVNTENGYLIINGSSFSSNFAGDCGGVIFSDSTSYITIDNSLFTKNYAASTGGAIFVTNTKKQGNTIVQINLYNSNFTENNNKGDNLAGKPSSPILLLCEQLGTRIDDVYVTAPLNMNAYINRCNINNGLYSTFNTTITQSTFNQSNIQIQKINSAFIRNNNQISENSFNSTNIQIIDTSIFENTLNHTSISASYSIVHNNLFANQSSISNTYYMSNDTHYTIYNNTYINTISNDNLEINIPNKIYAGEPITITGTYTINNPKNYDSDILEQNKFNIYINGELNQTIDTLEFTVTPTAGTMMVTVQPTISQTRKTQAIRATTLTDVVITPENYNEYIYEGALIGVSKDSKILFQGTFTDKGKIFIDTSDIVIDGSNATFTNTMFILEASGITLQNMKINNTQTEYPIQNSKDNNIITGNTITLTNTEGKTAAIYNKASNTEISYNTIIVDGPAIDIDHNDGYGTANTQAILLYGGDKNLIEHNTITVTSSKVSTQFGSLEAITNTNHATNTKINNNTITLTGNGNFKYGINSLNNVENITISNNNILVTGERYTDGIQVGSGAENILIEGNTIKCVCQNNTPVDEEAITYGITTVTVGGIVSNNITIQDNNIDLTGTANYAIELYTTNNTLVKNNTINVNGPESMGIGLAHSPNSTIIENDIKTSGDSTIPLGTVTEEIQPANVGIQVQQDSDNILIEDNTIQTYDKAGKDTCINITTNNVTVKNNNLTSSNKVGDNTITTTQPDTTTIEDNTAIQQESTTQTTTEDLTIGESTALTAQFYDDTYTPVGDGKAIFKVNGKTLRDDQGNVIYVDVTNGHAELPDINITQEWMKPDTTIQAVYIGDDNNEPITTKPTTVTVTKPEATITLEAPTEATAGTTITLKATVTDGDNAISSGRVAFKLNGKTLKDPKTGKALYANVENGVATIQYTIPEKTKAKTYNLTAVFTDSAYDRKEASAELVVAKA